MTINIKVDRERAYLFLGNYEKDLLYVKELECFYNDLLKHRGYLYMNHIYEDLSEWDPGQTNDVILYKNNCKLTINMIMTDDAYLIEVTY